MKKNLIIFDMDNTILQSRIDFGWMQREVGDMLGAVGLERYCEKTVANTMTNYCQSPDYDAEYAELIWDKICHVEAVGMDQAVGEPGAAEALEAMAEFAELAVLTNNTDAALGDNLGRLGLDRCLSCVAGRNSVPFLKPSPSGMLHIMSKFPQIPAERVITVGDAMIDAVAAQSAGIGFVAYNRSRMEDWKKWGIEPPLQLYQWDAAAVKAIRRLFPE